MQQEELAPGSRKGQGHWLLQRDELVRGVIAGHGLGRVIYTQFSPGSGQVWPHGSWHAVPCLSIPTAVPQSCPTLRLLPVPSASHSLPCSEMLVPAWSKPRWAPQGLDVGLILLRTGLRLSPPLQAVLGV